MVRFRNMNMIRFQNTFGFWTTNMVRFRNTNIFRFRNMVRFQNMNMIRFGNRNMIRFHNTFTCSNSGTRSHVHIPEQDCILEHV